MIVIFFVLTVFSLIVAGIAVWTDRSLTAEIEFHGADGFPDYYDEEMSFVIWLYRLALVLALVAAAMAHIVVFRGL